MSRTSIALTIAGSDSGGGAGIQADLKTFQAFGAFGTSVITAITAQNTRGVRGVHAIPLDMVRLQLAAVADDLPPAAFKTGMLATAELVVAIADEIRARALPHYVLDPVMVATSGDRLLDADAEGAVASALLPLCTLVTPNLDEARLLTGLEIDDESGMRAAGVTLLEMGAGAALVKGGHLEGREIVDVLVTRGIQRAWRRPKLETTSTHGTGCTLSAAITAQLARGVALEDAVTSALDYVQRAIRFAPRVGGGHGPLNHSPPELRAN